MQIDNSKHGSGRMRFSVGDVVALKSGGPAMTVIEVNAGGVNLAWFAGNKIENDTFPDEVLELATHSQITVKVRKAKTKEINHAEEADLVSC